MDLNPQQRDAVRADPSRALLVIAGAGSGKTMTLAHRVAHLVASGADPGRILLLTFSRRAAREMTTRAERILAASAADRDSTAPPARIRWAGTFHAIANRLLRLHAEGVGLDPSFTVLDRSDAADLVDLVRSERGLAKRDVRFPKKATCLAIYSYAVNTQEPLERVLERAFPWCARHGEELRALFAAYVEAKQRQNVLDYDDLLLYWFWLMAEPELARRVRERFDHVLVDEYQDTNALQASILLGLRPDGRGVTVVGDDAQSIYAFRAATVRNILEFPDLFDPPADVHPLEHNYRSVQPILDAANAVIALAPERFPKKLFSTRRSERKPRLVGTYDETSQVEYVVEEVLRAREEGVALQRQAVLMRAAHHSDELEVELARRNIPFVKYGGLKFLEAAHVKDALCALRFAENPRDRMAGFRLLQILPGIGPATASRALDAVAAAGHDVRALGSFAVPPAAREDWADTARMIARLRDSQTPWAAQVGIVRSWYRPHLERMHDAAHVRDRDLEQLEHVSGRFPSRERFLTELTLDPPSVTADEAGPPHLDEDFLILSTIHSAKGQEWDVVYVLNVVDGCIPSDMATGNEDEIEEERRLLYVAMTRARDELHLVHPLRFFTRTQSRYGDRHVYAPRSRFLPDALLDRFERRTRGVDVEVDGVSPGSSPRLDVAARMRDMWTASSPDVFRPDAPGSDVRDSSR